MNRAGMQELLTADEMRRCEQEAMQNGSAVGLDLMEQAGAGVVHAVFEAWPDLAASSYRALVLCGPGNNGGDGFVIARRLREQGWDIDVILYGDPDRLPPDAKTNCQRWCEMGALRQVPLSDDGVGGAALPDPGGYELVVDALFGTGLTRPFLGPLTAYAHREDASQAKGARVVAVDIPSGLCSDSGRVLGTVLPADLTVTFHSRKLGHQLAEGPRACGDVVVADIGLDHDIGDRTELAVDEGWVRAAGLGKDPKAHKYAYGHALVLSGPAGHGGAARLAARAALRVGAGLVTVACPSGALAEHAAHLNAVMCQSFDDPGELVEILADPRLNALCMGPALGLGDAARAIVTAALAAERATVLDADALTAHADAPETLFGQLHAGCVLTPHGGEFARLFPDIAAELAAPPDRGPAMSKLDATRRAAERAGCTVLFKGQDTVIASPTGAAFVHTAAYGRAAPWLATAGSGDVLSGLITGLMAAGHAPARAAALAAWLHVEAARSFGPGLIAEDLPETLPQVFRSLGI